MREGYLIAWFAKIWFWNSLKSKDFNLQMITDDHIWNYFIHIDECQVIDPDYELKKWLSEPAPDFNFHGRPSDGGNRKISTAEFYVGSSSVMASQGLELNNPAIKLRLLGGKVIK